MTSIEQPFIGSMSGVRSDGHLKLSRFRVYNIVGDWVYGAGFRVCY